MSGYSINQTGHFMLLSRRKTKKTVFAQWIQNGNSGSRHYVSADSQNVTVLTYT